MNQSELENPIIQLKSDKYVLDLEQRYGQSEFKNIVIAFLKSKPHKLLLLESSDTSATAWKLLQVLMELQCVSGHMVSNDYLGNQNRTMIKWGEISEFLQSFEAVSKLKNLTACEFDESVELFDKNFINTIIERISYTFNKKMIFIISSKDKVFFKKVRSDSSIYFNESENTVKPFYDFDTESLLERASVGDVSAVKDILDNGVDVNGTLPDGTTALHEAASNGCREAVLALLSNGAKHLPDGTDNTPLHYAAKYGHEDVVKLFLENKVDVNINGSYGRTALHYAAEFGHKDLVSTLLKHGAKLLRDIYNNTPLHFAAKKSHGDIVKLFIDNHVDVNIRGSFEQTALHYAAEFGHTELVLTLLKHGAKHLPRQNKDTPLHAAVRKGHKEVVNLLLENDVNINAKGFYGMTALHIAVRERYTNIIGTLVRKGPDINIKNDYGITASDLARKRKYIIKLLTKEEQGKN